LPEKAMNFSLAAHFLEWVCEIIILRRLFTAPLTFLFFAEIESWLNGWAARPYSMIERQRSPSALITAVN
jgi:hypothetical protein